MKILILTSGRVERLESFARFTGVTLGSFRDINYVLGDGIVKFKDQDLKTFDCIYFRFVGKSFEVASLVANYVKDNGTRIVDSVYESSHLLASSLGKSLELFKLAEAGLPVPKTMFGEFSSMDYPFVVKSTTGQKAREVWLVRNQSELEVLQAQLEKSKFYFAQELIPNALRIRVLVVGGQAIGAIKRQTKWYRDETREVVSPIPNDIAELAVKASKASEIDICGVDILTNSTGRYWIIEANAAPSWQLITDGCRVDVEEKIVDFLKSGN